VVQSFTIVAPGGTTPSTIEEGDLQSSWNVRIPGSLIQPNTSVLTDVDPDNTVAETNEDDNSFPASGTGQALTVQSVPSEIIRLVPIRQLASNSTGSIGNPTQLVDLTRRMHPLADVTIETGNVLTFDGRLGPADTAQWNQVLSDLEARRITDDAIDRTYYGLVHLDYSSGIVGNGFVGAPSAVGWDNPGDAPRVMAHELGHTWGQWHTPCGNPAGVDPNFPYHAGNIGVYGYDLGSGTLEAPTVPDIMGYCAHPWISDYIYKQVLSYRRSHPLTAEAIQPAQPCILVWGRIVDGRAVLEPSFQIVTRPRLPKGSGPYTIDARGADGSSVFTLSFDGVAAGDDQQGRKYFAFAVPLDQAKAARLGSLRLTGPGIQVAAVNQAREQLQRGAAADNITGRSETGAVRLQWNASLHPMLMVRDPDTGEVLSFARGGDARVWTGKKALDLEVSNGVQSQRVRLAISR
jgi:hypothetical protein